MPAALTPQTRAKLRATVLDILPHEREVGWVLSVLLEESERAEAAEALACRLSERVEQVETELANARTAQEALLERVEALTARLDRPFLDPEDAIPEPVFHTREWSA